MEKLNVGILIFDGVEVLDFTGPFEVFARTRLPRAPGKKPGARRSRAPFPVFTVAKTAEVVRAAGGLQVVPDFSFADAPGIDVLVVPGGFGTKAVLEDEDSLDWIRKAAERARKVTSVCTGSFLLAKCGLLEGKRATTHWSALDQLEALGAGVEVEREQRWVDDGVITSAGVAAGIDMAFYVVESLFGREVADRTARNIEYVRHGVDAPRH